MTEISFQAIVDLQLMLYGDDAKKLLKELSVHLVEAHRLPKEERDSYLKSNGDLKTVKNDLARLSQANPLLAESVQAIYYAEINELEW